MGSKRAAINWIIAISGIVFAFTVIEIGARIYLSLLYDKPIQTIASTPLYAIKPDSLLGYINIPNSEHRAILNKSDGSICYDVIYRTDAGGRRIVGSTRTDGPVVALFGDSLVFGEGLNDNDSLDYHLSNSFRAINFAAPGYGPQHTTFMLKNYSLEIPDDGAPIWGVYFLIPAHLDRVISAPNSPWLKSSPHFRLNDTSELEYLGPFSTVRPWRAKAYSLLGGLSEHSAFFQLVDLSILFDPLEYRVRLGSNLLVEARDLFEKRYHGSFLVVLHPQWHPTRLQRIRDKLLSLFKIANLEFLDFSDWNFDSTDVIGGGCDGHQNGGFNDRLAKRLAKALVKESAS